VGELAEKFARAKSVFLADFTGLNVEEVTELRRRLRESQVEFRVVKNTLARRALREAHAEALEPHLEGPTAVAFGYEDPVLPIKLLLDFARGKDKPKMKAALFEGSLVAGGDVARVAALPPRDVLLGQVCAGLLAPLTQFMGVLQGLLQSFVATVDAIGEKKKESGGGSVDVHTAENAGGPPAEPGKPVSEGPGPAQ
jgi:large subunit ribosomal protein L10